MEDSDKLVPGNVFEVIKRLAGVVNRTPVVTSRTLDGMFDARIFFKCENFQRGGAFKFRGAYNAINQLSTEARSRGVITHSSGNHAQGVALAASLLGVKAVIVMPEDAPEVKRQATAGYGARIVSCPAVEREAVALQLANEENLQLIHPYDNDDIILGQSTAAAELFDETGPLDYLFVPVGGGGLISGSSLAAAALSPRCRVIGVEPASAADANSSWRTGSVQVLDQVPSTIADGLRTRFIGQRNLRVMKQFVSDMVTVSEEEILDSLRYIWQRLKLVVEPSSAVALAPILAGNIDISGKKVGIILSGGNFDPAALPRLFPAQESVAEDIAPTHVDNRRAEKEVEKAPRILLCIELPEPHLSELQSHFSVDQLDEQPGGQLTQVVGRYDALIIDEQISLDGELLEGTNRLKAIVTTSPGLDNIGVSVARDLGIEIIAHASESTISYAEQVMSAILGFAARSGHEGADGSQVAGKTIGIIGFGEIGREVASRAAAFQMETLVNQPRLTPQLALAEEIESTDLEILLKRSDFVVALAQDRTGEQPLLGATEIAMMKPGAFLINPEHLSLVDELSLEKALDRASLAGALLPPLPGSSAGSRAEHLVIRRRDDVSISARVTGRGNLPEESIFGDLVKRLSSHLLSSRAYETLSLDLVPIEKILPHEHIDPSRVSRLARRLEAEGVLVNPPVVVRWQQEFILLDGATRLSALRELGFEQVVVQIVNTDVMGFDLHTWFHVVVAKRGIADLYTRLRNVAGLLMEPIRPGEASESLTRHDSLAYVADRNGKHTLIRAADSSHRLHLLNRFVSSYTEWGAVERTLQSDPSRLRAQFPDMAAVVVFPQFAPSDVFAAASHGDLLPAGLTRFVIPGRVLRLNADLRRLRRAESLADKRLWLNNLLTSKLARSALRIYDESVVMLDE